MKEKNDDQLNIDELLLNVLGSEFFKSRQMPICFTPVTPKTSIPPDEDKALNFFKNISD